MFAPCQAQVFGCNEACRNERKVFWKFCRRFFRSISIVDVENMWSLLNVLWFLTVFVNAKAAGFYYQRLRSREGKTCKPRLEAKLWPKYCSKHTPCRTIKDCRRHNDQCICDEDCGQICTDPTSTCTSGWCQNGGSCSDSGGVVKCSCPGNFTGARCELDVDECKTLSHPCQHGGTCTNIFGGYMCRCITGWEGVDCSINTDECNQNDGFPTCQHGGTCIDKVGSFQCLCPPGKTGLICQFDDQCASNPCSVNATCVTSFSGEASCICNSGWTGVNCDIDIQDCNAAVSPCYHGGTCRDIPGSFVCDCVPGFNGPRCENNINDCASNPCVNGICLDYTNHFLCACRLGWTGRLCDVEINECDSNPCLNGGQCHDGLGNYSCSCKYGYVGTNCETNYNDCASSPCRNGATCQDGIGEYKCICPPGFTGVNCGTNINECADNPCLNMGSCIDGINGYTCNCAPGFTGRKCEVDIDECASSPCQNGGSCQDRVNGYLCACPPGAKGTHCENDPDDCPANACRNGGVCIDGMNTYSCKCHPGFTGFSCGSPINECASSPCQHGGTCQDGIAQYKCRCPDGYTGRNCETKIDSCLDHTCLNGATCTSTSSYTYTCSCPPGYTGRYCEQDIDECASQPCVSGSCVDGVNGFICRCNPGFTGDRCHINIDDCQSSPCVHGGACIDAVNSYTCRCPNGFSGSRCEIHINECLSNPCQHGGTCSDKIGSYSCYCRPGYTGSKCQYPINRCQNDPCKNGGTCRRTGQDLSDFNCECPLGYKGTICDVKEVSCAVAGTVCANGGTCVDDANGVQICKCTAGYTGSYCRENINECAKGPCKYGATCQDGIANYSCSCTAGFTGRNCDININECASNPCKRGSCLDLVNGYLCSCPRGYIGKHCETNANDCFTNACFNGGTCQDGIASFKCQCLTGYAGSRCETDVDECASNPCSALGTENCINNVGFYQCQCRQGFLGHHCELNINECLSYPCRNGGQCKDGAGEYTCLCPHGFSGNDCERKVYTCSDQPCLNSGSCSDVRGSYNCTCMPGVYGNQCEWDRDECLSAPCRNGATCEDGFGSYTCKCLPGFAGVNCEQMINECLSRPCQNGGSCRDLVNGYKCDCPAKFIGKNCETRVKNKCPVPNCAKSFEGGQCNSKCNTHECNWDGTTCSLGIEPWANCTAITSTGKACYQVFENGVCDRECNTGSCLFDGFDCKPPVPSCKANSFCAARFANSHCDRACNNVGCLDDGLDCSFKKPELIEGTLVLVLLVTPESFLNGSRFFLRELSRVLGTIAFIKKDSEGRPMVKPYPLPPSAPMPSSRKRRSSEKVWFIGDIGEASHRYRRAVGKDGTQGHFVIDNRKCASECFKTTAEVAKFLGAKASTQKLNLPYAVYSVKTEEEPTTKPTGTFTPEPLWIAILCVGIPLFIVGVLAGGKRMYTKLWLPEGFPRRALHQRRSQRRDPVGQEHSMRSMNKSSTDLEEEGAVGGDAFTRADLTPPREAREAKRVKLEDMDEKRVQLTEKDTRQWTRLHREAADVNVRNCTAFALTPPQEGESDPSGMDKGVDARGPGGFTALHLASCRGTLVDGYTDDDKESDDSGGAMVSDLLALGASYGARTDIAEETPLHLAARHSRADAAKRLLHAGADPNARDKLGRTPLHLAVGADAQGVFQILLRNRATDLEARMDDGTTPLILAGRLDLLDIVKDLIKANCRVNNTDNQGKSALHWAAAVNSHEVTAELCKSGAKKDLQDDKGQTPLFLGAREGSQEAVKVLLLNYANRMIADNMDKTPEDIAKQKLHHDIVQLLTDWSIGCNSPKAAPAPTSPPDQRSPLNGTASPPCMDQVTSNGSVVTHFPVTASGSTRPKATSTSSRGARSKTQRENNGAKRKRRRRKDEEHDTVENAHRNRKASQGAASASYSPSSTGKELSPYSSGANFSPPCLSVMNGLSPQGSSATGISPSNSTTLSPPQHSSLDANSPPVFVDSPFDDLLSNDHVLDDLNEIDFDLGLEAELADPGLRGEFAGPNCGVGASSPSLEDSLSISCMLPVTTIGPVETDNNVPTTSDCMFFQTQQNVVSRRDLTPAPRLYSTHSSPNLAYAVDSEARQMVVAQSVNGYPSNQSSIQACTMANRLDDVVITSRTTSLHHNQTQLYHPMDNGNPMIFSEKYPTPPSAHSYTTTSSDSSPQKLPTSYLTPSPESPKDWSSSPHSSNSDWSTC